MRKQPIFYLGTVKDQNGLSTSHIYNNVREWVEDTFFPNSRGYIVELGRLRGKTYGEKKEQARELAKMVQYFDESGLSYGEYSMICDYFETIGKRFGLLSEFRENGIC